MKAVGHLGKKRALRSAVNECAAFRSACRRAARRDGLGAALIGPSSSHRIMAVKASQKTVEESMDSTVTPTPPKFPQDFTVAHFLDRIGQNPTEVDGDDAKVGLL